MLGKVRANRFRPVRAAGWGTSPSGIPVPLFDVARLGGPHLHALHCFMYWNKIRFANRTKPVFREPLRAMSQPTSLRFGQTAPGGLGYVAIGKASVEPTLLRRCGWRGRNVGGSDRGWIIGNDAIGLLRFFPRFLPNVVDLLLAVRATP